MTLEEAIKHAKEVSEKLKCDNEKCANEHKQLAEWLIELKEIKDKKNNSCIRGKKNIRG